MSASKHDVCVLKTDGINCEAEMAHAFEVAGGNPEIVHVNQLREGSKNLDDFSALGIPGGFSYGDDIASGKVLAVELTSYLSDQLQAFVDKERPILGVCNGFQVLARTGLLPSGVLGEQHVTLDRNQSGHFECRWIELAIGLSVCRFAQPDDFEQAPIPMQVAHGEGRFTGAKEIIVNLTDYHRVVFRYTTPDMCNTVEYPHNPNGSVDDIAGICDTDGVILGMMPHPERSITAFHPDRGRTTAARLAGQVIFSNIIDYAKVI